MNETIQEKVINKILGLENKQDSKSIDETFLNQKVMVRTYSAGVHFGTLVAKKEQSVILRDSRRVYYWSTAASLSQLSQEGDGNISDCKIAMTIPEIQLERAIEIIVMSEKAIQNLYGAKEWKV